MKVLHVVGSYPSVNRPQESIFIKTQIDSLIDNGFEVDVFVLNGKYFQRYLFNIFRLRKYIKVHNVDLIHAHYMYTGWTARLSSTLPLLVSFMGTDVYGKLNKKGKEGFFSSILHKYLSICLGKLSRWNICKSNRLKEILKLKNCSVIPNGIDLDIFKPQKDAKTYIGLNNDFKYVLFVSDPSRFEKRYDIAQSAFEQIKKYYKNVELIIARNKTPLEMANYYNSVDVLLLTSQHEGSPNVIKEALACNLPIVSVDVGDVKERITGIDNCYIVSYDPEEISLALLKVINKNQKLLNGRESIKSLGKDYVAKQLIELYKIIITKN